VNPDLLAEIADSHDRGIGQTQGVPRHSRGISLLIKEVAYSGRLNYVVKPSGEVVIGRGGHSLLSSGGDVLAAGEVRFANGTVKALNNASGHYQPNGESARKAAESAFESAGFPAAGKYKETKK
jgi:filamentous hemagglutinin